jgi:hypothetical protein
MIATTIEQSKLLLAAGFSPQEADMVYYGIDKTQFPVIIPMDYVRFIPRDSGSIPAWSLGALWNLCNEYCMVFDTQEDTAEQVIETMVTRLIAYKNIE